MQGPTPPSSFGTHVWPSAGHAPPMTVAHALAADFQDVAGGVPAVAAVHAPPEAPTGFARQNAGKLTAGMFIPQAVPWPFMFPAAAHCAAFGSHLMCVPHWT